jgi:hypothetical protein
LFQALVTPVDRYAMAQFPPRDAESRVCPALFQEPSVEYQLRIVASAR